MNFDSLISGINLALGNYILAVSEYSFSSADAISGINASDVNTPGLIRVTLSSTNGFATLNTVPEPGSLALLGLGLTGLLVARRSKKG